MALIDDLLAEIPTAELRQRLGREIGRLRDRTSFGLVFERHIPECLPLPGTRIRRGSRVALKDGNLAETFTVVRIDGDQVVARSDELGVEQAIPLEQAVAVKRFGEPVFPALRLAESVENAPDKPHHVLIEAENHSALQLLGWLMKGRVDCIYIDPPYNTGATTWMYNNKIVDKNDSFRSSKWLSMMERRLLLAKPLLADDGVLIVTIDENELATLHLLLESPRLFRGWDITVVTIEHNPRGIQGDNFSVTNEFALFVTPSKQKIIARRQLAPGQELAQPLRKWGAESERNTARNCFYPIRFRDGMFVGAGDVLADGDHPDAAVGELEDGTVEFWPIDSSGVERKWRYARDTVEEVSDRLVVRERRNGPDVFLVNETAVQKTVWTGKRYAAFTHGTQLVKRITGIKFPFPKSVYATHDCVEVVCRDRPNAVVLDFFAGSGTTANAVAMMNERDGGSRRSITVTNNEVGKTEAVALRRRGLNPGDDEWEAAGIAQAVTFPRLRNVITGRANNGNALAGSWTTGTYVEQIKRPTIKALNFLQAAELEARSTRQQLAQMLGFPANALIDVGYFVSDDISNRTAILLDAREIDPFIAALKEASEGGVASQKIFFVPPADRRAARELSATIEEQAPSITSYSEREVPFATGLQANLSYFRLEYLDPGAVEVGRKLDDLLPTLWLMAGALGKVPEATDADYLVPADSNFALLVRPEAFQNFLLELRGQPNVQWAFIVADSAEGFVEISNLLPGHIPLENRVRLYRSYLDNFSINASAQ